LTSPPRRCSALSLLVLLAVWASNASPVAPQYYSASDFPGIEKIDAHMHVHGPADRLVALAARDHFRILTINVDYPDFPPIEAQQRAAVSLRRRYPGRVAFVATFSVQNFQAPGWTAAALRQLDGALEQGAVGVKIWKNIGMSLRDPDGSYVMPDDRRLAPIFSELARRNVVLLGHQAEPRNCWLPFDQMTVRSDRDYFREHPQYYLYEHPEMPSRETILAARDRMLKAHPTLRFDSVHLASLEWDVDQVASFLDTFPQADVDVAARMVHLELQAATDPDKVRRFMIRYQERILYGSDASYGPEDSDPRALEEVHAGWVQDWRFLTTSGQMHSPDFEQPFQGLHLPREVVDRIYRRNAEYLFKGAWQLPVRHPPARLREKFAVGLRQPARFLAGPP
jgi:predicted TIM-barrel fold metal-dependent hydrolase